MKEEEVLMRPYRKDPSETEGCSPALSRLTCVAKRGKRMVLGHTTSAGSPLQKISKKQSTQSTMKQGIREH